MNIKKVSVFIMVVFSAFSFYGCISEEEPYQVVLPYTVEEGCEWTYECSTDGVAECVHVFTEPSKYEPERAEEFFLFSGRRKGEVEILFYYVDSDYPNSEPKNAYLVKLLVDRKKRVTEEPIGVYEISFTSFEPTGPQYYAEVNEEDIVHVASFRNYGDGPDVPGRGYDVVYTFSGRKAGTVEIKIVQDDSAWMGTDPEGEEGKTIAAKFLLNVDENLRVTRIE